MAGTKTFGGKLETTVFQAESLKEVMKKRNKDLPPLLKEARALAKRHKRADSEELFYLQAQLLANYEDDYEYTGDDYFHFYPTYQSLSNGALRGYFGWRTKLRHGELCPAPRAFREIYTFELFNNIGVVSPEDGYNKLLIFQHGCEALGLGSSFYTQRWLQDYIIYYNLNPSIMGPPEEESGFVLASVLERAQEATENEIITAMVDFPVKWLQRSKFYAGHREDMNMILGRVLKRMAVHYDKSCKNSLVDQYFGPMLDDDYFPFVGAAFADPLKRKDYTYYVNDQWYYECNGGVWSVYCRAKGERQVRKLEGLVKTVDGMMRQAYDFGHSIKTDVKTKWILKIIAEEIESLQKSKLPPKPKIVVDLTQLGQIRADADSTQEKLLREEENPAEPAPVAPLVEEREDAVLTDQERRLLRCLLAGEAVDWLKGEGLMLSVLVDGINGKLYDFFEDTVIDDTATVVADYRDEVKELLDEYTATHSPGAD